LKNGIAGTFRKYTIVTQRKVGQETECINSSFSKTYLNLNRNERNFAARKSSIYNGSRCFLFLESGIILLKGIK
jgi:hypothetical protein